MSKKQRAKKSAQKRSPNLIEYLHSLSNYTICFPGAKFLDLNERDIEGESALHKAVIARELDVVKELVQLGVELEFHGDLGYTPLHYAAGSFKAKSCLPFVEILVEAGAEINSLNEQEQTPLHRAAKTSQLEVCRYLVSNGANLFLRDYNGYLPVEYAKDRTVCEFLKEAMDRHNSESEKP